MIATRIATLSLRARQFLAALFCIVFLSGTHFLILSTQTQSVQSELARDLAAASSVFISDIRRSPALPENWNAGAPARMSADRTPIHAVVYRAGHEVWRSAGATGAHTPSMPPVLPGTNPVNGVLALASSSQLGLSTAMHRMRTTILIETGDTVVVYQLLVFADAAPSQIRLDAFGLAIWGSALTSIIVVLLTTLVTIRWNLEPVLSLQKEVDAIRSGTSARVVGLYPLEVTPVAGSLNDLLEHEAVRLAAQQKSLSNLAHSLKTPLAVIQSSIDQGPFLDPDDVDVIRAQVSKIDQQISYQLALALRANRATFAKPIAVEPEALSIASSLEKIHAAKLAFCEFEIDPGIMFQGDLGDLHEILGNLLENAFKWCRSRVLLSVHLKSSSQGHPDLVIRVDDDGPGIPLDRVADIVKRGVRADELTPGHGFGLSIVADIAAAYSGHLEVSTDPLLGGAGIAVVIPAS